MLTLVGEDWQTVRARMKRLQYDLAHEVGVCDWVWSAEWNPAGTGHHVHAHQRGDFIPQNRLSVLAARNGMGEFARIRRWHTGTQSEGYALKGVGYGLKGTAAVESGSRFLAVNGGRLTHQSRGYFEGGVRAAEARGVARARIGGETREWQVVTTADLVAATSPAPRLTRGT